MGSLVPTPLFRKGCGHETSWWEDLKHHYTIIIPSEYVSQVVHIHLVGHRKLEVVLLWRHVQLLLILPCCVLTCNKAWWIPCAEMAILWVCLQLRFFLNICTNMVESSVYCLIIVRPFPLVKSSWFWMLSAPHSYFQRSALRTWTPFGEASQEKPMMPFMTV